MAGPFIPTSLSFTLQLLLVPWLGLILFSSIFFPIQFLITVNLSTHFPQLFSTTPFPIQFLITATLSTDFFNSFSHFRARPRSPNKITMFAKILDSSLLLLALCLQVTAHVVVSPALGAQKDVKRPTSQEPCGANVDIAQTLGSSTAVTADANGKIQVTASNFNK